ncbi:hypothetical protein BOX15_Mlig021619g2, partial [Macrostomum lignano]
CISQYIFASVAKTHAARSNYNMKRVFHLPPKSHGSGGITFSWQKTIGNLIATTGSDQRLNIFDRHGEVKGELTLNGNCVGMDWNKDGDYLAVITDRSSIILLWDAHTLRLYEIDSGFKDALSFLSWSAVGPQLAVGSTKGNLLLYNHSTSRKVPILGKHSRKIICGCWSAENLLALGSEDKTLTVSNSDGDTLKQTSLRDLPSLTQFSEMKSDERSGMGDNTVSCVIGGKTLFLYNLQDPENPVELAFQTRYGHIVDYRWYGDGYIMIGFSQGYFVIISTHMKEIGQELFQAQDHKNNLSSVAISTSLGRCASAGDDRVRIRDLNEPSDLVSIITLEDEKSVGRVEWTEDGQLLAVATPKGSLHIFLTKLPMLGVACQTRIAYLTSLLEVTLVDPVDTSVQAKNLSVEVEPTFIGLGPEHLAVGMNNRIWFHRISESGIVPQSSEEYLGTVTSVKLNSEYAAALFEGKVMLHVLEGESTGARDEERERRLFPDKSLGNMKITCHDLTPDFLIFGTDTGSVYFFYMEDWEFSHDIKHTCGIKKIFPNLYGTRVIIFDDRAEAFVCNPLTDHMIPIPNFNARTMGAMWDQNFNDQNLFVTMTDVVVDAYYMEDAVEGPTCEHICTTKLPYDHSPLLLNGGQVFMHNQGGKLASMLLGSHSYLDSLDKLDELTVKEMQAMFNLAVKARRYKDAWILAEHMDSPERWSELAKATLTSLDIPLAIRLYREMGDVGMVMALQQIESHEDRNLLAGYASMFLEQFDLAQDLFLASSAPVAALDMRRDLLHWDSALQLAKALAPEEIPFISKEYAQQLEFTGDYVNALMHFEKGITRDPKHLDHDDACMAGIARVSLRLNDSKRGVAIATQSKNKFLKRDCAAILENMRQWQEAATLYEQAGFYDKAVAVYIRSKNLTKIGELLPYVSSPKLHLQYAKAREAEGRYRDAVEAYKTAKEWESVIRVCLDHLSDPEQAVKVVRESGSVEGAKLVANFFIKLSDYSSAIQFLVMSKCLIEAFQLAQKHGQMETYADIIGEDGATTDDYLSIAKHFENDRNSYLAGKFYLLAGNYERALKHFFRVPYNDSGENKALDLAIEAAGRAQDEKLTNQLIEFLMMEDDRTGPKDAKYLFRLYMALKQFKEAARTAVIIAREEQNAGNYRVAHDLLFGMMQQLRGNSIRVPAELEASMLLLHSYIIARMHIRRGDHLAGARLLIRVAESISRFPAHVVPILTSTVVECQRSGLKASAFGYASMLVRPEYKDQVDLKLRKKIETIVRRPDKTELEDEQTPCPYCGTQMPSMELQCQQCRNNIPYCIVTGKHMLKGDFSYCPNCDFPALFSQLQSHLESDSNCPMCSTQIDRDKVTRALDVEKYLNPKYDQ